MIVRTRRDQKSQGDRFRTPSIVFGCDRLVVLVVGGAAFSMPMSTPPRTTSLSLVSRMSEHPDDPEVWARFVQTYGEHVVYWCLRYGLQEADARDVAQDVLVRFWMYSCKLNAGPPRHFRAFLQALIQAAWSDWSQEYSPAHIGQGGTLILDQLREIQAREELQSRLERVYDKELLQIAMDHVQSQVEPHTWEAFRLLAVEHQSGREVAARLGMRINTAYMARCKVQRLIRERILQLEQTGTGQ